MEQYIKEMQKYAKENDVPIMQEEGMQFLQEQIKKYDVTTILELGSAIGYSAIQMCCIDERIRVVSIERDEKRYEQAVLNAKLCQLEDRITFVLGDALETNIEGQFDLLFIDAAKAQYIKFFERYEVNVKQGGIIVSDNLKFHGMVDGSVAIKNRNTRQLVNKIKRYITYLKERSDYDTIFYEFGDGVAISQKKK